MTTVTVKASQTYDVKIGRGLLDTLGEEAARAFQGRTVCIVSDTNVWPLYGAQAQVSLENAGFSVFSYVFPAGEACVIRILLTTPAAMAKNMANNKQACARCPSANIRNNKATSVVPKV